MVAVSVGVGGLLSGVVKAGVVFERGHCSTGLALFGFAGQMFACGRMQIAGDVGVPRRCFAFRDWHIIFALNPPDSNPIHTPYFREVLLHPRPLSF